MAEFIKGENMQYNRMVSNPLLVGAIELMKAEETPEHRKLVSDEIVKGTFICPATLTPVPEKGPDGKYSPAKDTLISFSMINANDGKKLYMAFTDEAEYHKWSGYKDKQFFAATFDDYVAILFQKNEKGDPIESDGFVINPFSTKIIVPKEMVAQYMIAKVAQGKPQDKAAETNPTEA